MKMADKLLQLQCFRSDGMTFAQGLCQMTSAHDINPDVTMTHRGIMSHSNHTRRLLMLLSIIITVACAITNPLQSSAVLHTAIEALVCVGLMSHNVRTRMKHAPSHIRLATPRWF